MVPRRQRVVAQGSIGIALQFGDVAEIIQGERVIRIEQVGLVEELLGLFLMAVLEFGNTLAVELLGGRRYAAPRNGDLQIAREPWLVPARSASPASRNRKSVLALLKFIFIPGLMMSESP
jgi:hypothetical protein